MDNFLKNIKGKFFSDNKNNVSKIDTIKSVAIIFYIPKTNKSKYDNWEDGFVKGVRTLEGDYNIDWINLADEYPNVQKLNQYDFLVVKSCWDWIVDKYIRSLKNLKTLKGIVVSCSKMPKDLKCIHEYDIIWYQTFWYGEKLPAHRCKIHAFGIDTTIFKTNDSKKLKAIDVLSIGAYTSYKRLNLLKGVNGVKKVVIGAKNYKDSDEIITDLENSDILCLDYRSQAEMQSLLKDTKLVYLPCEINGGGERAVLESRASGVNVKVENDNPKLKELLKSPIWDEKYYGNQIRLGLEAMIKNNDKVFQNNIIKSSKKLKCGRFSFHFGNFNLKGDEFLEVGSYCSFGNNISVYTSNHGTSYASSQGFIYRKFFSKVHPEENTYHPPQSRIKGPVKIGNDVWIGDDVKIMSGVTIGNGASIAAGSIVTKDVDHYEVVAGVPAIFIKYRFKEEVRRFLINLNWWDWSNKKIKDNENFFNLNLNEVQKIENIVIK